MKILFPNISFYPAQIGGPNNTLLWHTKFLTKNNINPIIITTTYSIGSQFIIKKNTWLDKDFGRIIYLKEPFGFIPLKLIATGIRHFFKSDIIHFNSIFTSATVYLIFIAVLFRRKVILSPRGELFYAAISRKTKKKKIVLLAYRIIKNKVLFHATSSEESETIHKYFKTPRIVIQSNFIWPDYKEKPGNINKNFVFLGRINRIKNIDTFIRGLLQSKRFVESSSRFIIAGFYRFENEKEYYDELRTMVADHALEDKIDFIGYIEGKEKEELLKNAFFLILPSKTENFGNVVVEALSCHTPVIASKGTPWEILEKYNAGYWVEGSPDGFSKSIDKALSLSEVDYIDMTNNAIRLVQEKYDVNSPENKWTTIYRNEVSKKWKNRKIKHF